MRSVMTLVALLALPSAAHAFCGTYVGGTGVDLYADSSEVVLVRDGDRTTLTMRNGFVGNAAEFAMLIPLPSTLDASDVKTVDAAIFEHLNTYSAPRQVRYDCPTFDSDGDTFASVLDSGVVYETDHTDAADHTDDTAGVTVIDQFSLDGTYDISILGAQGANGLLSWLSSEGYVVPSSTAPTLQTYIDAGSTFLAAKVIVNDPSCTTTCNIHGELPPLQVSYDSPTFGIPIRLGTTNARGPQDLIVYTITQASEGATGIANYPQADVEDDCMWDQTSETLVDLYERQFSTAVGQAGGNAWVEEYSWYTGGCDPCATAPPSQHELDALGFVGTLWTSHFTRLHMRYSPNVNQDVVLYHSGIRSSEQERFIEHNPGFEDTYPICNLGFAPNPGSCNADTDSDAPVADSDSDAAQGDSDSDSPLDTEVGPTTEPVDPLTHTDVGLDSDIPEEVDSDASSTPVPTQHVPASELACGGGGCTQSGTSPWLWLSFGLVPLLRRRR